MQTRQVPGVEAAAELPRLGGRTRPEGANTAALSDRRARMWPNVLSLRLLWRPCGVEPPLIVEPRRPTRGARSARSRPQRPSVVGLSLGRSLAQSRLFNAVMIEIYREAGSVKGRRTRAAILGVRVRHAAVWVPA